jgi:hypothetical protein
MEVRRDPRSFLFFIVLLLLINSPEPQQPAFNARARYEELIQREHDQLGILNSTQYGDFAAKRDKWLNITGLRDNDGFAWELLEPVKAKAKEQSERILGDEWKKVLDGALEDYQHKIPVYRNLSGYVQSRETPERHGQLLREPGQPIFAADGLRPQSHGRQRLDQTALHRVRGQDAHG